MVNLISFGLDQVNWPAASSVVTKRESGNISIIKHFATKLDIKKTGSWVWWNSCIVFRALFFAMGLKATSINCNLPLDLHCIQDLSISMFRNSWNRGPICYISACSWPLKNLSFILQFKVNLFSNLNVIKQISLKRFYCVSNETLISVNLPELKNPLAYFHEPH